MIKKLILKNIQGDIFECMKCLKWMRANTDIYSVFGCLLSDLGYLLAGFAVSFTCDVPFNDAYVINAHEICVKCAWDFH